MHHTRFAAFCAVLLSLALLAGCAGTPAASGAGQPSPAPVETERVPVVDEQYRDVLNQFSIVGAFHDGVAFAATVLPPDGESKAPEGGALPVQCGYVTLDGSYTPLYTVPSEYELISPEDGFGDVRASAMYWDTDQAILMSEGYDSEMIAMMEVHNGPLVDEQEVIDETFAVGDNGWVPYYRDGLWGYCDLEGNVTLAPAYDFVEPFYDGTAMVCTYDGQFHWSLIDETGAVQTAFEPNDYFAERQPGSDYLVMADKMATGQLFRLDGTPVDQEHRGLHGSYTDSGSGVLTTGFFSSRIVYDEAGNYLYDNDSIRPLGTQNGCAAFSDGTYLGILGSDGQVRCEPRFMDILALAPEGFYAREQGNAWLGLYDYDGNLLEQAPACVWVEESESGCALFNGAGEKLAEYAADLGRCQWGGPRLFADEGFAYVQLDNSELLTLHITFEERPVTARPQATAAPLAGGRLTVTEGVSQQMQWCFDAVDRWTFTVKDFDSCSPYDRALIYTKEGLEWYFTPQDELVICDEAMNTLFTIPQEGVQLTQATYPNGVPNHSDTNFRYMGDGLWYMYLEEYKGPNLIDGALYVVDREGNILLSRLEENYSGPALPLPGIASEGYFCLDGAYYSAAGQPLELKVEGEPTLETAHNYFSEGLAPTGWGYVDTRGELVLSAGALADALEQWSGQALTPDLLFPFRDGAAMVEARDEGGSFSYYSIDASGRVLEQLTDQGGKTPYDLYQEERIARSEELKAPFARDLSRGAFRVVTRREGVSVIVPSGAEVMAPEGWELGSQCIQWTDSFAFILASSTGEDGRSGYLLLDAQGNFYPEYCWNNILPTQGSSANVYGDVSDDRLFTMTHIEIRAGGAS